VGTPSPAPSARTLRRSASAAYGAGYHGLALGVLAASHYKESFRAPFKGALGAYASFLPYGHPSVRVPPAPPPPRHHSALTASRSTSPGFRGRRARAHRTMHARGFVGLEARVLMLMQTHVVVVVACIPELC